MFTVGLFQSLVATIELNSLFFSLGIQTGCETVLSQLANASCGEEKAPSNVPKWKAGHMKNKMKLHAAHVLTMDALLAVGLELGSHAPKCWKHVFRYRLFLLFFLQLDIYIPQHCSPHLLYNILAVSNDLNFLIVPSFLTQVI